MFWYYIYVYMFIFKPPVSVRFHYVQLKLWILTAFHTFSHSKWHDLTMMAEHDVQTIISFCDLTTSDEVAVDCVQ